MHLLVHEEETNFPVGAKVIKRDFYVNDMLSGGDSVKKVRIIKKQVAALLKKFCNRKSTSSNVPAVLEDKTPEQCEPLLKFSDGTNV